MASTTTSIVAAAAAPAAASPTTRRTSPTVRRFPSASGGGGGGTSSSTSRILVPILYLQMFTIVMFVAHEVFWDTTSAIVPKTRLTFFLPDTWLEREGGRGEGGRDHTHRRRRGRREQQPAAGVMMMQPPPGDDDDKEGDDEIDEEEAPVFVLGLNPPTPSPRKADAASRMQLRPAKFHYSNITRQYYAPLSCPTTNRSSSSRSSLDPHPEPERVPTFVLGGTQKAGTSALYYLLKGPTTAATSHSISNTHQQQGEPQQYRQQQQPPPISPRRNIVSSIRFETHFFDNAVRKLPPHVTGGTASDETLCQFVRDYRTEFPTDIPSDTVSFEKVPSYLCRSRIPSFLKRVAPWTKLVFILRNPIDRAHSAWKMEYNTPAHEEHPGFREVVDQEVSLLRNLQLSLAPTWSEVVAGNMTSRSFRVRPPVWQRIGMAFPSNNNNTSGDPQPPPQHISVRQAKIRNSQCGHLSRGFYAQQLIPWIEAFGRDQILILRFETFENNQTAVLQQILDFVGLSDHPLDIDEKALQREYKPRNQVQRRTGKVGGDMREYLRRFYQPYNEELADLLGDDSWKKGWT